VSAQMQSAGPGATFRAASLDYLEARRDSERLRVELLFTDCDLGMTFLDVAANSRNPETVERNRQHARKAYETVRRYVPNSVMTPAETKAIKGKLDELKKRLAAVGEYV
jgi:hypothetical protein